MKSLSLMLFIKILNSELQVFAATGAHFVEEAVAAAQSELELVKTQAEQAAQGAEARLQEAVKAGEDAAAKAKAEGEEAVKQVREELSSAKAAAETAAQEAEARLQEAVKAGEDAVAKAKAEGEAALEKLRAEPESPKNAEAFTAEQIADVFKARKSTARIEGKDADGNIVFKFYKTFRAETLEELPEQAAQSGAVSFELIARVDGAQIVQPIEAEELLKLPELLK